MRIISAALAMAAAAVLTPAPAMAAGDIASVMTHHRICAGRAAATCRASTRRLPCEIEFYARCMLAYGHR
ncbi:hypothetical protein ACFFJB_03770 [Camelimonas abortus]|uniref:Cysteine rich repeat-containing protein n=1 Tax=Camelimonas abortus TaxID=1017184 RepID=A0ABV7LDL1_9HYPH